MRVEEESAEAIVAKKRGNRVERRAEEHETGHSKQPLWTRQESSETDGRCHGGSSPTGVERKGRWIPAGGDTAEASGAMSG